MNQRPLAVLRADAGRQIGTGHVMRVLAVAAELAERGAETVVASHSDAQMRGRIEGAGHRLLDLGTLDESRASQPSAVWDRDAQLADAQRVLDGLDGEPDIVVVDHYGLDARWERSVPDGARILVLDDLANRPHAAQLVSDQNWYGPGTAERYATSVGDRTLQLLGPRYAVLQPEYRRTARRSAPTSPPRRVVVSFGGTDPTGETAKVLEALNTAEFADLDVDVVAGRPSAVTDAVEGAVASRPRTHLHVAVASLAPLLSAADLAIGASGAATWERISCSVPAIVATVAAHQSGVTSALHQAGATRWVGLTSETTVASYRDALRHETDEPLPPIPRIVDGWGAARLAEAVLPSPVTSVRTRPLEHSDLGVWAGLSSEADLLDGPSTWRSEASRFAAALQERMTVQVIEIGDVPAGIIQLGAVRPRLDAFARSREDHDQIATIATDGRA